MVEDFVMVHHVRPTAQRSKGKFMTFVAVCTVLLMLRTAGDPRTTRSPRPSDLNLSHYYNTMHKDKHKRYTAAANAAIVADL